MDQCFARPTNTLQINLFPEAEDCPGHYELGKFMLPKAQLIDDEKWDTRKFHLWYMEAAKAGMTGFTVKIPSELFHLPGADIQLPVDFQDMYNLLREEDLDIVQITLFSL